MPTHTATKAKGIAFSGPMVRAIREGRKTQTRRLVKPQPPAGVEMVTIPNDGAYMHDAMTVGEGYYSKFWRFPYRVGDTLWVRESYRVGVEWDNVKPSDVPPTRWSETSMVGVVHYEADGPHAGGFGKLRPGMFMPRWASRLSLVVTRVRVERVQNISEDDAIAEGCPPDEPRFKTLWQFVNGEESWWANPWVFAYDFRVEGKCTP